MCCLVDAAWLCNCVVYWLLCVVGGTMGVCLLFAVCCILLVD